MNVPVPPSPPEQPDRKAPGDAERQPGGASTPARPSVPWRQALLAAYPWVAFVLPLVAFLLVTSLEPTPTPAGLPPDQTGLLFRWFGLVVPYSAYPYIYTAKLVLVVGVLAFVWPGFRSLSPVRVRPVAVIFGAVGVVVWVGLCHLQLEQTLLPKLGLGWLLGSGARSGFNPLVELAAQPVAAYAFLGVRFAGLVLIVPLVEELFLRGFLMRWMVHEQWSSVPFGTVNLAAVAVGTLVPMAMHSGELLAAAVWFTMITGLMVWTRNFWDCVVAHAVTNLLLGVYVVAWDQWQLM